jgi:uncharacterized membrane protein
MTLLGSVTIPKTGWMWISAGFLVIVFASLIWTYRRAQAVNPGNKTAFFLKLSGVLILALCLLEPLWIGRRARPGANLFVVMADNSGSMNILDSGMTQSRAEILREIVDANNSGWLGTLADDFQIRQYIFDSRIHRTTDFSELTFDGKASSVVTALRTIAERYNDRPLAGVLLLSDGNTTDMTAQTHDFFGIPPVYPVVIGGPRPRKDISLKNVSVSQSSFEDAPVTIQADIETFGYTGKTIAVDLHDSLGQLIEHQTQNIARKEKKRLFNFHLRPDDTGILFYKLEVKEKPEAESSTQSDIPPEATMINNQRKLVVDRGGGLYRILYVTGRPNWEYKFLRRAVSEDEQVELVALLRVARREPKFNWIGRRGETSNPLYRGFDNTNKEQTEQYDQPVLVRLNTRDQEELRDGFPTTKEELFGYHAIILDDVEAEFFSPFQMDLIRRFVAERGGGFLMLGGKESFLQGKFNRTTIGQILPVYLDRLPEKSTAGKMYLDLTREGWLQPWARLHENETDEKRRLLEMPEFRVLNRLPSVKPGASVVATIGNDWGQQFPALIVQRFGNGRTGALTIGDLWRWGLREPQMHEDMNKFWRQISRWLVADVPERISLQASINQDQVNQPVLLQVRVRDKDFEPMDGISAVVEIIDPQGKKTQLTTEPVYEETGLYEATYIPRINGGYLAQVSVTYTEAHEIGTARTGWAVDLDAREFQSIKTNRPFLEILAKQTGGRIVELNEIEKFVNSLPKENVPITETWIRPLWETRSLSLAIFAIILICLTGEWTLRRWRGMP